MVKLIEKKSTTGWLILANVLAAAIFLNVLASLYFFRWDLTEEKRFTIQPQTRELLKNLDDDVFVEVFLEGDLNPSFKRFRNSIRETLNEFKVYSNHKVSFAFTNPSMAQGSQAQQEFMSALMAKGIQPTNVIESKGGKREEQIIFPGAVVSVGVAQRGVQLLKGSRRQGSQEAINQSIENVEFELGQAIYSLTNLRPEKIGIVNGHGELDSLAMDGFRKILKEQFTVTQAQLNHLSALKSFRVLIIAKPRQAFSDVEKYNLDQFILKGGRVLFLIDRLDVDMKQASRNDYFALAYDTQLEDLLFRYGIRINAGLIQDQVCNKYPVVAGQVGNQPQVMLMDWIYFPLIMRYGDHVITRNMDACATQFISSLDTVKAVGIRKTPLLFSSPASRFINSPVKIDIAQVRQEMSEAFHQGPLIAGCLLEGKFSSLYKNRFLPDGIDSVGFRKEGVDSKIIVVSDGDIARNDINPRNGRPAPLGFDNFTNYTYSNADLLRNMVAYLADEGGIIAARNKEIKVRLLDKTKRQQVGFWQILNLGLPLLALVLFGIGKIYLRKRKYT